MSFIVTFCHQLDLPMGRGYSQGKRSFGVTGYPIHSHDKSGIQRKQRWFGQVKMVYADKSKLRNPKWKEIPDDFF